MYECNIETLQSVKFIALFYFEISLNLNSVALIKVTINLFSYIYILFAKESNNQFTKRATILTKRFSLLKYNIYIFFYISCKLVTLINVCVTWIDFIYVIIAIQLDFKVYCFLFKGQIFCSVNYMNLYSICDILLN